MKTPEQATEDAFHSIEQLVKKGRTSNDKVLSAFKAIRRIAEAQIEKSLKG